MLTKVKACANLFVPLIGVVVSVLFMGCSSKNPPKTPDAQMDTAVIHEDMLQETSVSKVGIDSSQSTLVSPQKTDATSALDLSINPYYDAGYDQGQDDGYYDGIENTRGDSYDDACRYKERKGRNMSWGMKKDMMPALMMASLIVTVNQRRKNSLLQS